MSFIERTTTQSVHDMSAELRAHFAGTNADMLTTQPTNPGYVEHTQRSRAIIAHGAEAALRHSPTGAPRNALILGSGNCLDIPLEEIVDGFDHTKLVDVDTKATEQALSQLPTPLLGKVSLVGADVTGVFANFSTGVAQLTRKRRTSEVLYAGLTSLFRSAIANPHRPDLGKDYAFVSSHLLLSQITALPMGFLENVLIQRDPALAKIMTQVHDAFGGTLEDFLNHTQRDHMAHLSSLAARSGVVHFADTFANITPDRPPANMLNHKVVLPAMIKNFTPLHTESWHWQTASGAFYVVAHALQPKRLQT